MKKPVISGNTISIPSNQEFLADVDLFIEGILRGYGLDESIIADIAISVSELVNNAICHGNKSELGQPVKVFLERVNGKVEIHVSDQGNGFNYESIDSPIADENLMKEVGRGLFIVKSLMDSVDFKITAEGTTVVITKAIQ
jgi:serine/threonine-protein kinase RsbW